MSRLNRIPKSLDQKLHDLDDHLFIIREHLSSTDQSTSHLKVLSAVLRTLVCLSSRTEGLLWRLVDELNVNDEIYLHVPGDLNQEHPLAQGLSFLIIPLKRGGKGDPKLPPKNYSLRELIKNRQALVAGGKPFTHEYLIKAIAQQMGVAHECDGLEQMLVDIKSIFINGEEPHIPILKTNAELTLEIGERVLNEAERKQNFKRKSHNHDYGNISIVSSLIIKQQVTGCFPLFVLKSHMGLVEILAAATPSGIEFSLSKNGDLIDLMVAPYSDNLKISPHSVIIFSYCSRTGNARTIVDGKPSHLNQLKGMGWIHASDLRLDQYNDINSDVVEKCYVLSYSRLLSSEDSKGLSEMPPNGYGLWKPKAELEERGEFPE